MKNTISVNVEEELKEKADELFRDLGTDTETAIRMFLIQAIASNGFPFEIKRAGVNTNDISAGNPGKEKCEILRGIRKRIAEANHIYYQPAECTHQGPCSGTCPLCDGEISYLDAQIQMKKERGEDIVITGIAEDDIKKAQIRTLADDIIVNIGDDSVYGGVEPINDDWELW